MIEPDEYTGMGGQYVVDPKTGKRRQVVPPTRDAIPEGSGPFPADAVQSESPGTIEEEGK